MRRLALLLAAFALTACGSAEAGPSQASRDADVQAHQRIALVAPAANVVTKVLVFVEENHSLAQMKSGMPKTYALAKAFGYGTTQALVHPSLGNYIGIGFGSNLGVKDDKNPSSHKLKGPTVFGQALAAGRTAALYAQSQPTKCAQANSGPFAVRHAPWNYAVDRAEKAGCKAYSTSSGDLDKAIAAGTLPTVGMVVPNKNYDAHDGSLAAADKWFADKVALIKTGPDWKSGHLAIVLTADEDDKKSGNRVLTVVIHPALHGKVTGGVLTHYSLSGAMSDVSGSPRLLNAKTAPPFWAAFGLIANSKETS